QEEEQHQQAKEAAELAKQEEEEKDHIIVTSRGSFSEPNQLTISQNRDESKIMNRGILCALRAGDQESFIKRISNDEMVIPQLVDKQGNSPLPLASSLGHYHIVEHIVRRFGYLSKHENSMRETPLHVAARSGNLSIVKSLVNSTDCSVLSAKSKIGDTALHAALKGKHEDVAFYLVGMKHDVSFNENDDEVSPLYLAVEAGYYKIVRKMLECSCCPSKLASMSSGKSVVHAAMRAKSKDILGIVLSQDSGLVKSRCKEGKTCLSLGASIGFYKGVCYILKEFDKPTSHLCYLTDDDGFTPIHMAAKEGQAKILEELLKHCPDSIELLNNKCQNILHVAAESGKSKIVKYILGLDNQKRLVNEQDANGNTPLHLATKNWHPNVVSMLTWNTEVNLKALNNGGFTALDIAEKKFNNDYILRRRLTWMALISAGAPNGPKLIPLKMSKNKKSEWGYTDKFKDRINTLMVTATLVATVTFAAGFTLPGGYISSAPDLGMAVLVKRTAFKVFLLCDSIAMLSSMVTIMALIWAQLGDVVLIEKAFLVALPLLATALVSMTVAFMAGVSLVVSHIPWLAYFILTLTSVFLLALLLLIVPYVYSYPSQGFLRYIFYFPFILMIYAVSDKEDSSNNND
ncbi:PREDICTED: protein ACCELERATED CELL DEATH 6, partial [Camelina sativa]|uniref:Protein ACCELERATED CELL DEATH 6 n=1 Tax=Camelina sativa TaxID=90675 RepID=A0ABM1R5S2_CAMSA